MKYMNYYPQIVAMLKNIFKIFDYHEKYLESEYKARNKDLKFNYEKENILNINYIYSHFYFGSVLILHR